MCGCVQSGNGTNLMSILTHIFIILFIFRTKRQNTNYYLFFQFYSFISSDKKSFDCNKFISPRIICEQVQKIMYI